MRMRRNQDYNYDRRYGDEFHGLQVAWTQDIVSAEGAHYHCWIDRSITSAWKEDLKESFIRRAKNTGDPVSFSWDYVPKYKIEEYHYGFVVVDRKTGIAKSVAYVEYYDAMLYMNKLES